jgi:hypothetical protein
MTSSPAIFTVARLRVTLISLSMARVTGRPTIFCVNLRFLHGWSAASRFSTTVWAMADVAVKAVRATTTQPNHQCRFAYSPTGPKSMTLTLPLPVETNSMSLRIV